MHMMVAPSKELLAEQQRDARRRRGGGRREAGAEAPEDAGRGHRWRPGIAGAEADAA